MKFRMDKTLRREVEPEFEEIKQRCPLLHRWEILTHILREYESAGQAMRYVRRGEIAWKATPKVHREIAEADVEAEIEAEELND